MTTIKKLTEQARRLYTRAASMSQEDINPKTDDREFKFYIIQATNEMLKLSLKESIKLGEISIPTCMIATYDGQTVTGSGPYFVDLPAYPIYLPMDMGVWSIASSTGVPYIPISPAAWDLIGTMDEGLLEDQVGFLVEGRRVRFTRQPTAEVTIKLLITDPSQIGDNDPYPVPPEMELSIVQRAVDMMKASTAQAEKPKG